jgi:hypothetical protein
MSSYSRFFRTAIKREKERGFSNFSFSSFLFSVSEIFFFFSFGALIAVVLEALVEVSNEYPVVAPRFYLKITSKGDLAAKETEKIEIPKHVIVDQNALREAAAATPFDNNLKVLFFALQQ